MSDKKTKSMKISTEAHEKITQLRSQLMDASRERIMEAAVDMLYDFIRTKGVPEYFKMVGGVTGSRAPGLPDTDHRTDRAEGKNVRGFSTASRALLPAPRIATPASQSL
jgi:hypothetical protein